MPERGRLGVTQVVMILVTNLTIWGHLIMVGITFEQAGRDAWLAGLAGGAAALSMVAVASLWATRWPSKNLITLLQELLGWVSPVISVLYLAYWWLSASLTGLWFGYAYSLLMPATPHLPMVILLVGLSVYALITGIEPLGRVVQILLVFLVLTALGVVAATAKDLEFRQLLPIMVNGPVPVLRAGLTVFSWLSDMMVILMLHPVVRHGRSPWGVNMAILCSTILFLIGPLIGPVAVFGPREAARLTLPTYEQLRYIRVGNFLEHLDSIAILWWTVGLFARMAVYHYLLALGSAQVFRLKEYKPLILPAGVLIVFGSTIVSANTVETGYFLHHTFPIVNLFLDLAVPAALLAVGILLGWRERPGQTTGVKGSS